jgi:hypothetical protein
MFAEKHVGLTYGSRYYCRIVTQSDMCSHILVNVPNIKFNENPFLCLSRRDETGKEDGRKGYKTDSHLFLAKSVSHCIMRSFITCALLQV